MIKDQRDPKHFRRYRDQLIERLYEAAQRERQRHGGHHLSPEFRDAIARVEEFDAAEAKTVVRPSALGTPSDIGTARRGDKRLLKG